jgi:septal ring factor EnvC (AmiA/AmiB activator)
MTIRRPFLAVLLVFAIAGSLLVTAGCTKYASPDDLQRLDEAKQAAILAEKDLDKIKVEHRKLEADLADKEKELQAVQADLERAKQP